MIEKISRIPLRDAFPHEARNFSRWLQENLDVLSDVIDLKLVCAEREQSAGDFSVDLVAEDDTGKKKGTSSSLRHPSSRFPGIELQNRF